MILGIDFGITTTDVALLENNSVKKSFSIKSATLKNLGKALNQSSQRIDLARVGGIALTGGKAKQKRLFGKPVRAVPELEAIGFGGAFLSGLKNALVVSMGTGTCIVSFKKGRVQHVAGTALGGGTIIGLSKRLFNESRVGELKKLAATGSRAKVDLSVKEAIGSGIGLVPGAATASNFVKKGHPSLGDLALGVQNMVGESNAVIAALAAKSSGHKRIVFVGKAHCFPAVRKALKRVLSYYGFSPIFPRKGQYATAIGAAVFAGNCFK